MPRKPTFIKKTRSVAFQFGWNAKPGSVNPFTPESTMWKDWAQGFRNAEGIRIHKLKKAKRKKNNPTCKVVVWDWSKRDVELAALNGLTRERIRQIRKEFDEPSSGSKEWHLKYTIPFSKKELAFLARREKRI